ncbi:MAG: hypothetical protein HQL34_09745 [Alphaproteobacteria bacterium]|nr:hypothetical protein [Alphaproteobacteria bacterium]
MDMTIIRRATLDDLDAILAMLEDHIAACGNDYPQPERTVVAQTILSSFHHTAPLVVFLAESDGTLTGIACAVASSYLWAKLIQTEIRLVLVDPAHRGGPTFLRLVKVVRNWAEEKKSVQITFTLASGIDDERIAQTLERLGWKRTGIDMVRDLP